jgi:hypothetical protein
VPTIKFRTALAALVAATVSVVAPCHPAFAGDWQYCLAPSEADHKVYISEPFPAYGGLAQADDAFNAMLVRSGLRHDVVQCPRADDESAIAEMLRYAVTFNREIGNTIVYLRLEKERHAF